ncbi:MAG: copper resistance protein B, partial [Steroidobacteraceae bacterium]
MSASAAPLEVGTADGTAPMATGAPADLHSAMLMDDTRLFGRVLLDQLEWRHAGASDAGAWDVEGWYGGDVDKLWISTEGEQTGSTAANAGAESGARAELLWGRALGRWWNLQAGVREDFTDGPARTWAAVGVEGLAPY